MPRVRIMTWNMQGATGGGLNKWTNILENSNVIPGDDLPHVLCLQECGALPGSAMNVIARPAIRGVNNIVSFTYQMRGNNYRGYHWANLAEARLSLAILYNTDLMHHNFANRTPMVTPAVMGNRPLLGIRFSNPLHINPNIYTFYTIHAISPGGPNARRLLAEVNNTHVHPHRWFVAGDFNRTPDANWAPRHPLNYTTYLTRQQQNSWGNLHHILNTVNLYYPRGSTQQGGRSLDCVASNIFLQGTPNLGGGSPWYKRISYGSDHCKLLFYFNLPIW